MQLHPHRAIVVRLGAEGGAAVEHQVLSHCWRPAGQRDQICCEQIEITAPAAALPSLAPALAALHASDLPSVIWIRGADFSALDALEAQKAIVDSAASPDPAAALARLGAGAHAFALADLAWTRLTPWRESVARLFEDSGALAELPRIDALRVFHPGDRVPAEAFYAAGWIHAALGRETPVRFERAEDFGVEFASPARLSARRRLAPRDETSLLSEELAITGRDPIYDRALQFAARLAGRERR
jgi:glucose-6-phosphate dehydrogenase assembly protein OpcA